MKTGRPKLKVPMEPLDIVLDMISITLLLLIIVYTFLCYSELPNTIVTHFNAKGEPDSYGSKLVIWLLPVIGTVMFIGLSVLNRYPHIHNYMVNITEDNALKNYRLSTRIVRFVNFFTIVLFAYIQYIIITSSNGAKATLGPWFLPIVIGLSVALPITIFVYTRKINNS